MQFLVYATDQDPTTSADMTPEQMGQMGAFIQEAYQAGKIVATGSLAPTGTRLRNTGDKFTVTDGPFIEVKELMGGFAVLDVDSLEDAIEWSKRFRAIVGDGETEIVRIYGPQDRPPA